MKPARLLRQVFNILKWGLISWELLLNLEEIYRRNRQSSKVSVSFPRVRKNTCYGSELDQHLWMAQFTEPVSAVRVGSSSQSQQVSYLAAFFLPEDGRRRVSFGATEEGYGATRGCDLVPRPDHDLRGHCNRDDGEKEESLLGGETTEAKSPRLPSEAQ